MTDNNPQAGQGRPLPKKESDLFRHVVKHYEMKQYKKAVKQADAILKKYPKHGETLAMKGLTLNAMKKREEAHSLVKEGLRNDMRSHVCWHVYGLLHRSDRKYNEAIKAYKQALRIDPENLQILRDLSLLQVQMRDLSGFAVTRHSILTLKPNAKVHWLAFALAKHLAGDLRGAVTVIDAYLGTLTDGSPELERGFEPSELALYRNTILAEVPDNCQEALDHLSSCEKVVVDRTGWLMMRVKYELFLGRFDNARATSLLLLDRGLTEDYRVHSGYMCAVLELDGVICREALAVRGTHTLATATKLNSAQKKSLLQEYRGNLSSMYPRSPAVRRIQLTLLDGDELRVSLDAYCRKAMAKGMPSLCSDVSALITEERDGRLVSAVDPIVVGRHPIYELLVGLVDGYIQSLISCSKFSSSDEDEESPSTLLWAWYTRAGLHELIGEYSAGISLLDQCLEHTPTAVDIYELKARLLKSAGDMASAVECVDLGRELDKQDRYINNLTAEYMLQAGREDTALERISLFTKHEGNPEQNLFDMQCSWYELELAECLARKEEWGRSLKKFGAVVKHFEDIHEDQFDFHAYCVRKVTLRAYTEVLRFEDNLWGHGFYQRAAAGIIKVYLYLYDNPKVMSDDQEPDYSNMTAAEKKKAKAVARKKKKAAEKKHLVQKQKEVGNAVEEETNGGKKKKNHFAAVLDPDPNGKELLKKDPLEEASLFSSILSKHAPSHMTTWMLQYDVSMRRGKTLLALQALFKARSLDPENGELLGRIVEFATKVETFPTEVKAVRKVLVNETPNLLDGKSVVDFVQSAREKVSSDPFSSLSSRAAVAKVLASTGSGSVVDAASMIVNGGLEGRGVTISSCREALTALRSLGADASVATEQWIAGVKDRFPLLVDFS